MKCYDLIVLGAGITGLSVAREAIRTNSNCKSKVGIRAQLLDTEKYNLADPIIACNADHIIQDVDLYKRFV
jgi:hypothetical protein